ncbi:hypothetical protein EYZ11_011087 [Aspergillus tanneri]|uniref:AA1-like domain-containing protein n=1 Tax=Aspergillus tanneri TaxID=1220188 RepID=A0A4S3J4A4_9EURO|nr:uncharacterized protein ATNIH1004_003409 [Aspergillus tanneri]KAA8650721.1 hypothetical protein ATNIH1004_003409 [Aspergillus tanneri]THC89462.1 hypothetical protein EYZ11_011087 [Aspergillus tanneri]
MHLSSVLAVALSAPSLTNAVLFHRNPNPALTWQVSNFTYHCSPGGCVYVFSIHGAETKNTPGFTADCLIPNSGKEEEYTQCDNEQVKAKVTPAADFIRNVKVEYSWLQGVTAEFHARGQINITLTDTYFTIPVTEVSGIA